MTKLEWDSAFFDFPIAFAVCDKVTLKDIDEIQKELSAFEKALCYLISKEPASSGLHPNLYPMPAKVTYSKQLGISDKRDTIHPQIFLLGNQFEVGEELLQLAYLSSQNSRFKVDSNFSTKDFQRLYKEWLQKSLDREIADEFYVYRKDNQFFGFLTLKFKVGISEIGLISVNQAYHGEGIGTKLIQAAISSSARNNCEKIIVSTQDINLQACAFYEKNNFSLEERAYFSHLWNFKK
jgi:dTDP-4-amino-4,6-dideoxy-D-galactose acyltransferase